MRSGLERLCNWSREFLASESFLGDGLYEKQGVVISIAVMVPTVDTSKVSKPWEIWHACILRSCRRLRINRKASDRLSLIFNPSPLLILLSIHYYTIQHNGSI